MLKDAFLMFHYLEVATDIVIPTFLQCHIHYSLQCGIRRLFYDYFFGCVEEFHGILILMLH